MFWFILVHLGDTSCHNFCPRTIVLVSILVAIIVMVMNIAEIRFNKKIIWSTSKGLRLSSWVAVKYTRLVAQKSNPVQKFQCKLSSEYDLFGDFILRILGRS